MESSSNKRKRSPANSPPAGKAQGSKRQKLEVTADQTTELVGRILLVAAQAGYADDVFPAASVCKALYNDQSLWTVLSGFRAAPLIGVEGATPTSLQNQARQFCSHRTPLMAAAKFNNSSRVSTLLSWFQGAGGASSSSSSSPSSSATSRRADLIDAADVRGKTALHWAAECGNADVAALLIEKGLANPSLRDKEGRTALHSCCAANGMRVTASQLAVARALLSPSSPQKGDVNARDFRGETPFNLLCDLKITYICSRAKGRRGDGHEEELICLLLKAGAQVSLQRELFDYACDSHMDALAELLIETGHIHADGPGAIRDIISDKSSDKTFSLYRPDSLCWPLFQAARRGKEKIALRLLDDGTASTDGGIGVAMHPLYLAAETNMIGLAERLVTLGADINRGSCREHASPLLVACAKGHAAMARLLVAAGADVNIANEDGTSAFGAVCAAGKDEELALFLLKNGSRPLPITLKKKGGMSALSAASSAGFERAVRWILDNRTEEWGIGQAELFLALNLALRSGHAAVAQVLLQAGVHNLHELEIREACKNADKPGMLELAITLVQPETISFSSPGQYVGHLSCALKGAAKAGNERLVAELLEHKAPVHYTNLKGKTALWIACSKGHTGVVLQLLAAGADPSAIDAKGRSPLQVAVRKGHLGTVKALLQGATTDALDLDHTINTLALREIFWDHETTYNGTALDMLLNPDPVILASEERDEAKRAAREEVAVMMIDAAARVDVGRLFDGGGKIEACIANGWNRVAMKLLEVRQAKSPWVPHPTQPSPELATFLRAILGKREALAVMLVPRLDLRSEGEIVDIFVQACKAGMKTLVEAMIAGGFDPNLRSSALFLHEHYNGIIAATVQGHFDVVESLLKGGADPNVQDLKGRTALHAACRKGRHRIATLLLSEGKARVNVKDSQGQTPLAVAFAHSRKKCITALLAYSGDGKVDPNELIVIPAKRSKRKGHSAVAPELWIPLHAAAAKGLASVVKHLLIFAVRL